MWSSMGFPLPFGFESRRDHVPPMIHDVHGIVDIRVALFIGVNGKVLFLPLVSLILYYI